MHDKNGKSLKTGDKVNVEMVIEETYATFEFCNVRLGIGKEAENSAHNVHGTLTINAKQVELKEDEQILEVPTITSRGFGFSEDDLDNLFTYHAPKGNQAARYAKISEAAKEFARVILQNTPKCADQTATIRKLIDVRMSANATIAINE